MVAISFLLLGISRCHILNFFLRLDGLLFILFNFTVPVSWYSLFTLIEVNEASGIYLSLRNPSALNSILVKVLSNNGSGLAIISTSTGYLILKNIGLFIAFFCHRL